MKEIYAQIRNLVDELDFLDDLVAKKDHAIYLAQKTVYTSKTFRDDSEFSLSDAYKNEEIDYKKYFQIVHDIDINANDFSKRVNKKIRELKDEIDRRKDLLEIREQQLKDVLGSAGHNNERKLKNRFRIRRAYHFIRKFGLFRGLLRVLKRRFMKMERTKIDFKKQTIIYVVNALAISGGMQIVIRHVNELHKRGYNVIILSFADYDTASWLKVDAPVFSISNCDPKILDNPEIMIATHWSTAPYVSLSNAKRKIYFVQSDERRFILEKKYKENIVNFIEETYKADMEFMTEGIWIQKWLKEEFGKDAYYVPNGLDRTIFYKTTPIESKGVRPRVLLEGQINYWLRGMEEAYEVVKDLDCELWIISSWGKPPQHWKYDRFFEKVPFEEMTKIYSSCDIFLKMSKVEGFFGPPMEAMTCGCAVVVNKVSGYDEYIKHEENALVVESGDVAHARDCVKKLLKDEKLRMKLVKNAMKVADDWNWEQSIDLLEKAIKGEPITVLYNENFPEPYDFKKENKKIEKYLKKRERYLFGL